MARLQPVQSARHTLAVEEVSHPTFLALVENKKYMEAGQQENIKHGLSWRSAPYFNMRTLLLHQNQQCLTKRNWSVERQKNSTIS